MSLRNTQTRLSIKITEFPEFRFPCSFLTWLCVRGELSFPSLYCCIVTLIQSKPKDEWRVWKWSTKLYTISYEMVDFQRVLINDQSFVQSQFNASSDFRIILFQLFFARTMWQYFGFLCGPDKETSVHILCRCAPLGRLHNRILSSEEIKNISHNLVLTFIDGTGLF